MIDGKTVLAIIPARGGSKGLPRKNVLPLCGRPLVGWPIKTALESAYIDRAVVSTDDEEIAKIALREGADVPFLRPADLATDTSDSISVVRHAIEMMRGGGEDFDYCVLLEPTSPLTEYRDVDSALERLDRSRDIADSIVGVSKVVASHPAFDVRINRRGLIEPYGGNDFTALRRQEIAELFFFDGSLYISDIPALLKLNSFYHDRTLPYITPKWKSLEIDDFVDFICAEAIMENLDTIRKEER